MQRDTSKRDSDYTSTTRLYYRAREVAALTGLALRTVYEGIYAGWIPSRKIGNSRLIPAAWLHAQTDREAEIALGGFPRYQYTLGTRPRWRQGECAFGNGGSRRALHLPQHHSYVLPSAVN